MSQAMQRFNAWSKALASGNPETVADLYDANAVLVPTLSASIRSGRAGIIDYFTGFLRSQPKAVVTQSHEHAVGSLLIHSGLYAFACRTAENKDTREVKARFTFVHHHGVDGWKIIAHHSSLLPTEKAN